MSLTAVRAGAYLHHLAFESSDPERLAGFYRDAMDMDAERYAKDEWRCQGPDRRMIVRLGTDRQLAYAGLACRDKEGLEELRARAAAEGLSIIESQSPYFLDGAFAVRDPDSHLICFGLARQDTVKRKGLRGPTQHLTFASFDVEAFAAFYHDKLGFALSDRVVHEDGTLATCFVRSNHEHHTIACFKSNRRGVDHTPMKPGNGRRSATGAIALGSGKFP